MGLSAPIMGTVLVLVGGVVTGILCVTEFFPKSCTVYDNDSYMVHPRWCGFSVLKFAHMWNAGIFILAGIIGVAASRTNVAHRKAGLKTGFIVLATLIAVLFGPSHVALGFFQGMFADSGNAFFILGWLQAVVGLFVTICSIVAASSFCCCMPINEYEVEDEPVQVTGIYSEPSMSAPPSTDSSNIILNDYLQYATNSPSKP